MGYLDDLMRERQEAQNAQKPLIPAKCALCGKDGAEMYAALDDSTWVPDRAVYKDHMRKFLCLRCKKTWSPSRSLSLFQNKKTGLLAIPLYDETSVKPLTLLSHTFLKQIVLLPHYYPLFYLGQCELVARWVDINLIADATILRLIPTDNLERYMPEFLADPGFIYTSLYPWMKVPMVKLPLEIIFSSFYDSRDKPRTRIMWRDESHEETGTLIEWVEEERYNQWIF